MRKSNRGDNPTPCALRIVLLATLAWIIPVHANAQSLGWINWNGPNFLGPCQGDCGLAIYGGKQVTDAMEQIFFVNYPAAPPWKWHWGGSEFVATSFSRRLVRFADALDIEPEVGLGKRFGDMVAMQFWGGAVIRWTVFPWNDVLKTSMGFSEGLSLATQVENGERVLNDAQRTPMGFRYTGSIILNYFSPEITFALPQFPAYELLIRFDHRSGIFGLIKNVHAGVQYETIGFRVRF